jgi:hypothetical protein
VPFEVRRALYVPLERPVLDTLNAQARARLVNPRRLAAILLERELARLARQTPDALGSPVPAIEAIEEAPCAS